MIDPSFLCFNATKQTRRRQMPRSGNPMAPETQTRLLLALGGLGLFGLFAVLDVAREPHLGPDLGLELAGELLVLLEELLDVVPALAEALALVGVPRAGLVQDARLEPQVGQVAFSGDAFAEDDVELGL